MTIRCPHCGNVLELTGAKAGLMRPRCPACRELMQIEITDSADGSRAVTVQSADDTSPPPPPTFVD
ncbi:MAG: hypothetical protein ACREJC_16730 [Tepidisphaeraceae bacterium]